MNVRIDKSFAKNTDKIKDQSLKSRIADVIGLVQQAIAGFTPSNP